MRYKEKSMENIIQIQYYQSPCGELILGSLDGKLCLCDWMDENRRAQIDRRVQKLLHARYEAGESEVLARTVVQLNEYLPAKEDIRYSFAFCGYGFPANGLECISEYPVWKNAFLCRFVAEIR